MLYVPGLNPGRHNPDITTFCCGWFQMSILTISIVSILITWFVHPYGLN